MNPTAAPPPPRPHRRPQLTLPRTSRTPKIATQEWHLLMEGCPDTPYEGGWYVAKLKFPAEYPFKPPAIFMCTPSGRFATGTRLCLSMSDFHPESWNPGWSVATVAKGLLSFMCEEAVTTGAVVTTRTEKERLAKDSVAWNKTHGGFKTMFPELDGGLDAIAERGKKGERECEGGDDAGGLAAKVDTLGLD